MDKNKDDIEDPTMVLGSETNEKKDEFSKSIDVLLECGFTDMQVLAFIRVMDAMNHTSYFAKAKAYLETKSIILI